jgi:hypothetical protein
LKETVWLAHPSWFIVPTHAKDLSGGEGGTMQGRIVCKNPAAQTFPPPIQRCIRSRWPDGVILSPDLSQIELRVAALLSGDATMIREYQKPDPDLHTDRAISIFGLDYLTRKYGANFPGIRAFAKSTKGERQVGKHVGFGDLFRAGAATMQSTVLEMTGQLLPISLFEKIVRERPFTRPGLWSWQEDLIATARRQGYIELPFVGQSRYFMGGTKFNAMMDMEMGPDGKIYILEYGNGWFAKNPDAGLFRIDYNGGNRAPVVSEVKVDKTSGKNPLLIFSR